MTGNCHVRFLGGGSGSYAVPLPDSAVEGGGRRGTRLKIGEERSFSLEVERVWVGEVQYLSYELRHGHGCVGTAAGSADMAICQAVLVPVSLDGEEALLLTLWELEDAWEGRIARAQVNDLCADMEETQHHDLLPKLLQLYVNFASGCGISCWHASETESVAMWQLYGTGTDGIAIATTVEKLERALALDGLRRGSNLHIGMVQYIDHDANVVTERPPERVTALQSLFQKSREFSHEREVRFVLILPQGKASSATNSVVPLSNLDFIDEIVVSPTFPSWAYPSIQSILSSVGITKKIKASLLTGRLNP